MVFYFLRCCFRKQQQTQRQRVFANKKKPFKFFFNVLSKEARAAVAKTIKLKAAANGEAINHT